MARSESKRNLLVGAGVFVGVILFVVGVFIYNQGAARWKDKITITADFRQVSGLRVGSPVQLEGIDIGTVTDRQFIDVDYPCDPETEDRGRFGHGRTDKCDSPMFCAPEGKCAELEPYTFNKTLYPHCEENGQCQEQEICVTADFRRRYRGVIWSGNTGVCDSYIADHKRIRVELSIHADKFIHVREDSRAVISQNGVLGDQLVQLSMGRDKQMQPGGRIQTIPAAIEKLDGVKERAESLFGKVENTIGGIAELAKAMGDPKTVKNVQGLLANANDATRRTAEGKGSFGALLNDESFARDFTSSLRGVRASAEEVNGLMNRTENTMRKFDEDLPPVVDKGRRALADISNTLKDVRDPNSSSPTGALLYDPEGGMTRALANSFAGARRLSDGLLAGDGTLGRFITDPKGYDDLVRFFQGFQHDAKIQFLIRWALKRDKPPRRSDQQ
jgi:ABC-type transporter Mla subunit MlaD